VFLTIKLLCREVSLAKSAMSAYAEPKQAKLGFLLKINNYVFLLDRPIE
jgi:hypothetical protein